MRASVVRLGFQAVMLSWSIQTVSLGQISGSDVKLELALLSVMLILCAASEQTASPKGWGAAHQLYK